jgi:hypothetical protein
MPVPEVAMPQPKTPSTLRRHPLSLAVLAACAALAPPTGAEILQFTGNAPVYTASWYNGYYTEYHEFQYYLDWQGYCNAHFGATCASTTFWGVPFNWDANRLPTATDDVRTPVGSVVVISQYDSIYKGFIPGDAFAGTLTADGQIRIGNGLLHTDNASIADLSLGGFSNSGLVNNGLVTVGNLSGALGSLSGSGTTQLMAASTPFMTSGLLIKTGHTLEFFGLYGGVYGGYFGPRLEPNARLINYGTLDGASVMLQGTANSSNLPRFINRGTLTGGLNPDAVRVDNEGSVTLGDGGTMSFGPAGVHSGSFLAGLDSVLTFGGPWGHEFLPGSSLNSDGKVVFASGVHKVGGSYSAQETQLSGYGSHVYVSFKGPLAHMPKLHVDAGSGELRFETPAAASIGELTLDTGYVVFDVAPGSNPRPTSTVQTLTLNGGVFNDGFWSGTSTPVNVVDPLLWNAGSIGGTGGVTAQGGIEINAATGYRGLGGLLRNAGTANWHGGALNWDGGTFENLAGATFNIMGNFSGGGYGRFINAGSVIKTAGSGVATLGMAFDNSGLVQAQAGTLRLNGGGTHDGGRFEALPGALIELSGSTSLKGAVTAAGRVDITGGSLTLLSGASFTQAAGNRVNVTDLSTGPGASFVNRGDLNVSGILDNQGSFTNHHASATFGTVVNAGTLINTGGLTVGGSLNSTGSFRNDGAGSRTTVSGTFSQLAGNVVNEGSLEFMGGDVAFGGTGSNLGQIYNGGGTFTVLAGASLANPGSVVNDGGTVYVRQGGFLGGSGSYVQYDGLTWIRGTLQADAGIDIQGGILRGGTPPGYSGPTAGTVIGNVSLGPMAQWQPGNSPGTFTVVGDVTVQGNGWTWPGYGNIEIEFDSPTAHDRIVVTGTFTLDQASIDLVFAPGFSALDGDSLEWLNAGNVVLPNGSGSIYFQFSGLPTGWYVTPTFGAKGMSIEFVNLAATPIPLSGPVTVAAGEQAYNDGWGSLDGLTVAGNLSNRPGGAIWTGGLAVDAGGRLINRGVIDVYTQVDNAGELINRSGGSLSHDGMLNTGSMVNEGQLSGWGDFVNQGQVVNAGQFEARTFYNEAGGRLVNTGSFYHFGQFYNEAGGRVENGGQMTADGEIVNRGEFIVSGHLQNNASTLWLAFHPGSILNDEGGVFTVETGGTVSGPGTYFQLFPDSVTRVNGTLAASDITLREGVLTGSGTLVGPVTLGRAWGGAGAAVQPGNSPGTLTIDGDLTAYGSTFDIELAGPSLYDRLVVTGDARFTGGVVNFLLHSDGLSYDYRPAAGDAFTWLIVGGAVQGLEGLDWNLRVVFDSGWAITVASSWGPTQWIWGPTPSDGVGIHFTGDRIEFTAAPVPEPQTWALLLAGLGLVGWMAQRRRSV